VSIARRTRYTAEGYSEQQLNSSWFCFDNRLVLFRGLFFVCVYASPFFPRSDYCVYDAKRRESFLVQVLCELISCGVFCVRLCDVYSRQQASPLSSILCTAEFKIRFKRPMRSLLLNFGLYVMANNRFSNSLFAGS